MPVAQILEVSFASLSLLVHDRRLDTSEFVCSFTQFMLEAKNNSERYQAELVRMPSSQEVLCSQARRGVIAASACLPRILQVLLASMPNVLKYQDSLKEDIDVQTQATLVILHFTKFPYALTAYRSGVVLPVTLPLFGGTCRFPKRLCRDRRALNVWGGVSCYW